MTYDTPTVAHCAVSHPRTPTKEGGCLCFFSCVSGRLINLEVSLYEHPLKLGALVVNIITVVELHSEASGVGRISRSRLYNRMQVPWLAATSLGRNDDQPSF